MFEKFLNTRSKTGVPCVNGQAKSRRLSFNRAAKREYGLDKYEFCNLYFDKAARQIGVEFVSLPEPCSVKVSNSAYDTGVSCGIFAKEYNFSLDDIKKAPITSDGKMLIISI